MTLENQVNDLLPPARWRAVLDLGEQLLHQIQQALEANPLAQVCLDSQGELIAATAERLVQGRASLWLSGETLPWTDSSLQIEERESASPTPLMQRAFEKQKPCFGENSLSGDCWSADDLKHPALPHAFAAPIFVTNGESPQKHLLGVLQVERSDGLPFEPQEIELLDGLAIQAGLGLQAGLQLISERRRVEQLSLVYEVSNAITSVLDQENLLLQVVSLIQKRFGFPFVHLFSVHPGRRKVFYEAGTDPRSQVMRNNSFAYDLDDPQGIIPWAARSGETILSNDVSKEPRYRPSELPPDETLSEMAVPLIFGGEVLGVLDVESDRLNAFSQADRFLFEALARQIAIAMRNAFLYRSETWRRQVADSLREVAGLLSADLDLDQVLVSVLEELDRNLPLDVAAIWLLDEEGVQGSQDGDPRLPELRLAAVHGAEAVALDLEIGLSPGEILDLNPSDPSDITFDSASDWLLLALHSNAPVIRTENSSFDPLGGALDYPADYSAIAAPLRIGEQNLGVLTLAHHSTGRYGSEAQAMTAAFASYAAVAIENTRLYESAHEQAWISTVLLQVAQATQTQSNLNDLLTTVIQITPMLVGVKACLLYIVEDETFIPAAASGLTPDQQAEFERWRFASGDVPALDRMRCERQPGIISSQGDDLRLVSILVDDQGGPGFEDEMLVMVPLLVHDEVLGAFVIDYEIPSGNRDLGAFFDDRLTIIQGIAHQTAVAVENIRLLKSQKEEAYVSVALLQVAQAVVSSNELDEALGAIVRITPILVGVERVAVFLWDRERRVFRLSQSYGLPRDAGAAFYAEDDFPLLDAVRQWDSLIPYPVQNGDSPPDDPLEIWGRLAPPELEEIEDLLADEPCLLMAFPLSVKGEVLGVLLVEEPETITGNGLGQPLSNRRLRNKRMEIITGITQQAAMAIQNDLLQGEIVERERLEREMQLARDIQRAFLPQVIPDLPGWELKVLWRTAREVGGDFYDFFELPGNRLGLVIADVADKGMPAALYMTLVRTLVRAAVQSVSSPARVLERVNDILEPDAPQGMFVTLAYAVLDLAKGELEYANAGHNPPILVRKRNCQLKRLTRGGMALGVQPGSRIQGRQTVVEPGDYLVLYTDGVTEAFSPQGELFGEERLLQTIEGVAACLLSGADAQAPGAQEMLDAIDASVASFSDGAQLADDLTLVVIKRNGGAG
ncbi:MAG: SpoIIE family protein phosphatase [Anaerolineales bacterium]|nr:SpoIIE family protein phosphatase [Anaerolineales bacterium]